MTIQAMHDGICGECKSAIRPGDVIEKDKFTAKWVHSVCPKDEPRPVCPKCFTEIPRSGACMCEVL